VGYLINGVEVEADDEGFLLEPDFSEEAARAIAQTEGIELTDEHWLVIRYLHERFQEDGQTPNFRNMVKDFDQEHPGTDWKTRLYELFPNQPARQGCRVAGLTKPFGKGGY
jgi:tRNA 2-thiouridine synthesizing protein E